MTGKQLRDRYLKFFIDQGHTVIPSAPLVPINDPSTLFTSSGMQPLVPYLLGQSHPGGVRLVDSQKCFRSQDIEDVGDNRHTTIFEMLGNWSLGDYFKKEQLEWFFEFLTNEKLGLGLNPNKLFVTVFSGDPSSGIPSDKEAIEIWTKLFSTKGIKADYVELGTQVKGHEQGMQGGRIFGYGVAKNWWSRSGVPANMPPYEPGGPDSEVFFDFGTKHDPQYGERCHPNCDCGRFMEIGNSVFMQYQKQADASLKPLPKKNVDFGGGLERLLAATNGVSDVFATDLFQLLVKVIEQHTEVDYVDSTAKVQIRVVVDHLKASVFLVADGVEPANKAQGYFLRRLIRRSVVKLNQLGLTDTDKFVTDFTMAVFDLYEQTYFKDNTVSNIAQVINQEINRFRATLNKGLRMFTKAGQITGKVAFDLLSTYGFPLELTLELAQEAGQSVNRQEFDREFKKHQDLSRSASKGMFKGGLADDSVETTKLHTATHLLHSALRQVLGEHVRQEGSHITSKRLRFDFAHTGKLTDDQIRQVETIINANIKANLEVVRTTEDRDQALASGAMAFFREKYPDRVSVYTIKQNDRIVSRELCGGPHVARTSEIGSIVIGKQEAIGSGKRRIYVHFG